MDFVEWLNEQVEKDKSKTNIWIGDKAVNLHPLPNQKVTLDATIVGYIRKGQRYPTEGHVLRIARALKADIMECLRMAGYVKEEEVKASRKFKPGNPALFGIWNMLNQLDAKGLGKAEGPILKIIESHLPEENLEEREREGPNKATGI